MQAIRRGLLMAFYPTTYTADVLILEAGNTYLQGIPAATHLDGTSAQIGTLCAVLFFDTQNPTDAVVLAVFPNGSSGIPSPAPGRVVPVAPTQQVSNWSIASGTIQAFTVVGGNIPGIAAAVLVSAYFTSATVGAYLQIGPHGSSPGGYLTLGNLAVANGFVNGAGIVPLSNGQLDIAANAGTCLVNLWTYGYIM
jgi:hypothetical protein